MKISHIILLGFIIILFLFSFTTYINFRQGEELNINTVYVNKSTEIIRHSNRVQRNILNMVSGLRGYLLTGEEYLRTAYDSSATENQQILRELFILIPDSTAQYRQLIMINQLNNEWINDFAKPLIVAKNEAALSPKKDNDFHYLYQQKLANKNERDLLLHLQDDIRAFNNDEYKRRGEAQVALVNSTRQTKQVSFLLTMCSVLVGLVIAIWLAFTMSRRILKMVKMSDSIAAGNYDEVIHGHKADEFSKLERSLSRMGKILAENISLLKNRNEELDQFAHIVSHDLKSPLRGISNVVSWIEEDHEKELSPKIVEYLGMIKNRIVRGERLVEGLLSYARVGKQVHSREEVNTRLIVEEILQSIDIKPGQDIIVSENLPVIKSEKIPLIIIFSNLISNAVKYSAAENSWIKIYHKDHPSFIEFYVEDNGIGIDEKHHEKIYMIFQTLQTHESFESSGVGLAIVKKLLDNRNEKIFLTSQPGKGSSFSFTWKKNN